MAFPSISLYVINISLSGHEINEYTIIPIQNRTTLISAQEILAMLITGTDIIEIARIGKVLDKYGSRFLNRIYTQDEQKYCRGRAPQLASRFAAKEAFAKALGTGFRRGVFWRDIVVENLETGQPIMKITGGALMQLQRLTPRGMVAASYLSQSDEYPMAHAIVIIEAHVKGE